MTINFSEGQATGKGTNGHDQRRGPGLIPGLGSWWGRRIVSKSYRVPALILALGLTACAGTGLASTPATMVYTRNKCFCLPIALDNQQRAAFQEVQLYVKKGAAAP